MLPADSGDSYTIPTPTPKKKKKKKNFNPYKRETDVYMVLYGPIPPGKTCIVPTFR